MYTYREYAAEEPGQYEGAPLPGGGNVGGGSAVGGNPHHPPSEHYHAIYCDKAHYGPVSSNSAAPRSLSI